MLSKVKIEVKMPVNGLAGSFIFKKNYPYGTCNIKFALCLSPNEID